MARDRNEPDDDDDDSDELLSLIKRSRRKPVSFAFGLATDPENNVLALHRKLLPFKLFRQMKMRNEVTSKGAYGTISSKGTKVTFSCFRILPSMKKHVKKFFRANGWTLKANIIETEEPDREKPD